MGTAVGGLLSVALSLGFPPLVVIQHPALRCPDFPPAPEGADDHPVFFPLTAVPLYSAKPELFNCFFAKLL